MTDKLIAEIDNYLGPYDYILEHLATRKPIGPHEEAISLLSQCRDRLRWVPCSERLPEAEKHCFIPCFIEMRGGRIEAANFNTRVSTFMVHWEQVDIKSVKRWLSLSQPPQQEQQEQGE